MGYIYKSPKERFDFRNALWFAYFMPILLRFYYFNYRTLFDIFSTISSWVSEEIKAPFCNVARAAFIYKMVISCKKFIELLRFLWPYVLFRLVSFVYLYYIVWFEISDGYDIYFIKYWYIFATMAGFLTAPRMGSASAPQPAPYW